LLGPKLLKTEVPRFVTLGKGVLNGIDKIVNELHLGQIGVIIRGNVKSGVETEVEIKNTILELKSKLELIQREISVLNLNSCVKSDLIDLKENISDIKPNFIMIIGEGYNIEAVKFLMTILPKHIEWVSIPTSPVHDGFASPFIFLRNEGQGEKYYGIAKTPVAIIADTNLLEVADPRTIKSGIGILLSRYTSNWDWKLASRLRSEPISDFTALVSDEIVNIQASNIEHITSFSPNIPGISIQELMKGLIITGFLGSFSNNIRASYGSEHMFAQALDDIIPGKTLRGERVALGTIMMASLQGQDWRLIRSYYKNAGLAVTAKDANIKSSEIIKALLNANKYPSKNEKYYTILGEKGLTEDAAFRLVYRTGIIGNRPGLD
jgi:glycerol-1-phosphate dehydrogenase [NAD(P)+]